MRLPVIFAIPVVLAANAAAVDVGSEKFFCSVSGQTPVVYLTVTQDMKRLCADLKAQGVKRVAMEATGVYWINLFGALEEAGFEAVVVNGAHCRNIPGRKTDMKDSQWLAVLHEPTELPALLGQLQGAAVPALWAVYPKGGAMDAAVRTALRAAGWRDAKACAVSERLTATRYLPPTVR